MSVKSYPGVLQTSLRTKKMLTDSFNILEKGANAFLEVQIALYGGITPEIIGESFTKEKTTKLNVELLCGTSWFRLVPADKNLKNVVLKPLLVKTFENYYGSTCSSLTLQYFQANVDEEKYSWIDCRKQHEAFCSSLGASVKQFAPDLTTMLREDYLPLPEVKPNSSTVEPISGMFGEGEKENRPLQVKILKTIDKNFELKSPTTRFAVNKIIYEATNSTTPEEFVKNFGGKGRPNFLEVSLRATNDTFADHQIKAFKKSLDQNITKKSNEINWEYIPKLKSKVEKQVGTYHLRAWGQMWSNSMADIQSKNTRNYNFASEQLALQTSIDALETAKATSDKLNAFFESKYFNADNEYDIEPQHLGNNLPQLFKLWKEYENEPDCCEMGLTEYCDNIKGSLDKSPSVDVLRYIYSIKEDVNVETIKDAAKYNQLIAKHKRQSVHPTVKGNSSFTWGISALNGTIIAPPKAQRNDKNTPDARIWLEIDMLDKCASCPHDNGQWKKHHIPFFNSRFFEEVYAYDKESTLESVLFRSKRFGYNSNPTLSEANIEEIRNAPKDKRKAVKRQMRVKAAIEQKTMPNADWQKYALNINRVGDEFNVKVSYKFETKQETKFEPSVGQIIVSYDQNQTAETTYAVLKIVDKSPNSFPFRGVNVVSLETGIITSKTTAGKSADVRDQLSYKGIEHKHFQLWRDKARQFVEQWKDGSRFDKRKNIQENVDFLAEFNRIEGRKSNLYEFNANYARLLVKILRGKSEQQLKEIRPEILRLFSIEKGSLSIRRLSSLNHHSFDAIAKSKSLINAYFSNLLPKDATDDDKYTADPEIFEIRRSIESLRVNKGKEKINRIANKIITIALEQKATWIIGEGELTVANKKSNKKSNTRTMDWLARGVFNKVTQLAPMHNISVKAISSHWTSHQDPGEHDKDYNNPVKVMRCRFESGIITDWQMKKFSLYLKNNSAGTAGEYYYQGMQDFIKHNGIQDLEERIKKGKLNAVELMERLENKSVLYPKKGGRIYLSTNKVTSEAEKFVYNGRKCYWSDADEIAAVNIGLAIFKTKKANASVTSETP